MEFKIGFSDSELCDIVEDYLVRKGYLKSGLRYSEYIKIGRLNDLLGNLGDDEEKDKLYFYFKEENEDA